MAGVAPGRARIALMLVLLAAAMPLRVFTSLPLISSASILDVVLLAAAVTLFLDLAFRPVETGYRELFWLLSVPLLASIVSLAWSEDRPATVRVVINYAEGLVAYLFVIRELAGLSAARVITYIKRYAYLLMLPGVLLLLHVPGFAPAEPGLDPLSAAYEGYYTRFSHPVLGRSNNLATVLAFFAPILLYWGHTRRDRRVMRAGFITVIALGATLSRGVLLAFLIAGLIYAPLAYRRRRSEARGLGLKVAATVALGVLAVGVFYGIKAPTDNFFQDRFGPRNVEERAQLYTDSFEEILGNPLLGLGSGVQGSGRPAEAESREIRLDLYNVIEATQPAGPYQPDVHNTYLQQALYFGLPLGLLVSLALCGTAGVFLARRRAVALAGVLAYAVMVQLISFLFESSFEGTVLRVLFYLSIGMAAALLRSAEREALTTAPWLTTAPRRT